MKKNFVIFFSPGTFVAEQTEKPIKSWDIEKAKEMAKNIKERYNATPYGFCFTTRKRSYKDLDSEETKRSGMYFLGGTILTLEDVRAQNNPKNNILISNMECNGWKKVVKNENSWSWVQPFKKGDQVISFKP